MPRITLKHTVAVALAASTLAMAAGTADASAGLDRYTGLRTSSLAGTSEQQDLRGERALDAAHAALISRHQDLRGEHARDAARFNGQPSKPPVYWTYDYQAPKPAAQPVSPAHKPTGDTDVWLIVAIALAAAGIVAGTLVVTTRHARARVPA